MKLLGFFLLSLLSNCMEKVASIDIYSCMQLQGIVQGIMFYDHNRCSCHTLQVWLPWVQLVVSVVTETVMQVQKTGIQ